MATCSVCNATLAHFENPPRDICPNEPHAKQKQVSRNVGSNRGGIAKGRKLGPRRKK